jgi:hypothetical protein
MLLRVVGHSIQRRSLSSLVKVNCSFGVQWYRAISLNLVGSLQLAMQVLG